MFDEAKALYGTVKMCGKTQDEFAKALGVSQSFIANKLRLLKFSHFMQQAIIESGISERHARTMLRLNDEARQYIALKEIVNGGLSVEKTEELVETLMFNDEKEKDRRVLLETFKNDIDKGASRLLLSGVGIKREIFEDEENIHINLILEK